MQLELKTLNIKQILIMFYHRTSMDRYLIKFFAKIEFQKIEFQKFNPGVRDKNPPFPRLLLNSAIHL